MSTIQENTATQTRSAPAAAALPLTGEGSSAGAVDPDLLASLQASFKSDDANITAQNAVTRTTIDDIALNRRVVTGTDHSYSHTLDDWAVTNQKASGRCWLFAGLNLLRVGAMREMKLKDFEFSQNYTLFWHKLERSNFFLEAILQTADREVDDRTVAYLLDHPNDDGGQWTMFTNIVKKYGLLPKAFMPETQSSSATRKMNALLTAKLKIAASELRAMHAQGKSAEEIREDKQSVLDAVYRMLCIHLGDPPRRFTWQWNDKDRQFHRDDAMSPQAFSERYVNLDLDRYVCLVNDPRPSSPFGQTYSVAFLGNVVGADPVLYLNVEIKTMKDAAMNTIMNGEPVWFGCDMGKMTNRKLGIMDDKLYEYARVYRTCFKLDKGSRLNYHLTKMSHAMLFTGVDVVDGNPRRWRVENSWGEDAGQKGFFVMSDSWFSEHMFEIVVKKTNLPGALQQALETPPIVLPPWDPMGALAAGHRQE